MARAYPVRPGVPAAGHVSANGFWHHGAVANCHKQPCHVHHFVQQWSGRRYLWAVCACGERLPDSSPPEG